MYPAAILDFFFYQSDRVNYVAHLNRVRAEINNGLWKVGEVGNLFLTVFSGQERQIEHLGMFCFVQNGVSGSFKYFGHKFPRWFVFCDVTIGTQLISFITVQWTPYPQGFRLPLEAFQEKLIDEGKHDIEWTKDAHAIGLVKMSFADTITLFSAHAKIYS